ncbi:MAG TPA: acyl-CoA reductase [Thermoguttaceae bacterium]|nr:acyl-CoA reductase [Thermoguttaceae bacterium]
MSILRVTPGKTQDVGDTLGPLVQTLNERRSNLAKIGVETMLALFDDFSRRLLRDPRTQTLEGVMFLSAWLGRRNLEKLLKLNLNGDYRYLDGFVAQGRDYLAAKPHGLAAMWMAGNVPTLPMFALVPALLTKNACLLKVADADTQGMEQLLAVLAEAEADGLSGSQLLEAAAIVWFDYRQQELGEAMSRAADVKVIWGGAPAIRAIRDLSCQEHCVEIVFGPKYSIGLLGRHLLERGSDALDSAITGLVRDIAIFDQRACSSPQTIFVESNSRLGLDEIGGMFADRLDRLPPKPDLDAYTTTRILNVRAQWALDESKDVVASPTQANWTVCMDREASLKEAIQSRTIFLTEVGSWRDVIPLLSPKVQTVGTALGDVDQTLAFADAATDAGVVRCVRPGLMNVYESPWDGKLLINQLVRWVTLKP